VRLDLGYDFKRAQHASRLAADALLAPLGLTTPRFLVMLLLDEDPGISSAELARRSFISPQAANAIVRSLEHKGLVTRRPHPVHGRILETRLTDEGRELYGRGCEVMEELIARTAAPLTPAEKQQLHALLHRCIAVLEAPAPLAVAS
jgi:DNA-binding MarR family transcriptional regulator